MYNADSSIHHEQKRRTLFNGHRVTPLSPSGYDLEQSNGGEAGKVITGQAESNGSLQSGL